MEQVAQRDSGLFFSGDTQNPPGRGLVQPALGDLALAGGLDQMIPRGPFQPLPFCDSVKIEGKLWPPSDLADFYQYYIVNSLAFSHSNGCFQPGQPG